MQGSRAAPWLALGAYALLYFSLVFSPGVLKSDDFGYLRGVLGTLERGRLFTYDWLAPYGASMTALCAAAFHLTGRFYVSTWGMLALASLVSFVLLLRLLSARLPPGEAAALALAFMASPFMLAKASDFHGSLFTTAFFLAALICHEKKRDAWFFLFAFLAFANRQSQAVLMVLPLWRAVRAWRGNRRETVGLLIGIALFAGAAAALSFYMNPTYARAHALLPGHGPLENALASGRALLAGVCIALGILSLCGALFRSPWRSFSENLRGPVFPLCATVALLVLSFFWPPDLVRNDTPMFWIAGWAELNRILPWLLLVSLWFLDRRLLRPSPYLALAGAFLAISSLRAVWWDYYFLEVGVLALLIASERMAAASLWVPARWALAALIVLSAGYGYLLKVLTDKERVVINVFETLERRGGLNPGQMTGAPFGYLGWKLFDHFLAEEGEEGKDPAGFQGYVRKGRVVVETQLPWRRAFPRGPAERGGPSGVQELASGEASIGFFTLAYRVVDLHGPDAGESVMGPSLVLDISRYRAKTYPLDEEEWRTLLSAEARALGPVTPK